MQVRGTLRKIALSALLIGAAGAVPACVINDRYSDGGYYDDDDYDYPPARPRHGYRYAYPGGLTLIYDSGIGFYSVLGYPDYYFYDGYFYRWHRGYWDRARYWNRGWQRCDYRRFPRPIYYVHNHYYRHGRRPHYDWHRDRDWDRDHHDHRDRDYIDRVRDAAEDARHRERSSDYARRVREAQEREEAQREEAERAERQRDDGYTSRVRDAQQKVRQRDEEHRRELSDELRERSRESDPVDQRRHPDQEQVRREHDRGQAAAVREAALRREREHDERRAAQRVAHEQRREAARAARPEPREEPRETGDDGERSEGSRRGGPRGDDWQDQRGDRR
jgi:hypothetical protein